MCHIIFESHSNKVTVQPGADARAGLHFTILEVVSTCLRYGIYTFFPKRVQVSNNLWFTRLNGAPSCIGNFVQPTWAFYHSISYFLLGELLRTSLLIGLALNRLPLFR
uniref:Uncharacterized protein n=1 Tax=Picea glauca TaxID=3330 RepID=A0A117NHG1_PICGL|nr:hypothetical protein ABT39_MTgene5323 [Picea glauca]QHR88902.1 hypothetical protein Q903MT_gene2921 [Picea sitchensis]